jgi:hypothetical protein
MTVMVPPVVMAVMMPPPIVTMMMAPPIVPVVMPPPAMIAMVPPMAPMVMTMPACLLDDPFIAGGGSALQCGNIPAKRRGLNIGRRKTKSKRERYGGKYQCPTHLILPS